MQTELIVMQGANAGPGQPHFLRCRGEFDLASFRNQVTVERWEQHYNAVEWRDNRENLPHPTNATFRLKSVKEALWMDHGHTPEAVALARKEYVRAGTGRSENSSGSSGGYRPIFDGRSPRQDPFYWTARISKVVRFGQCRDGLTGSSGDYRPILDGMLPQQDPFYWNARISKLVRCGQCRHALKIYEEMRERGVQPSSYTFVAALKACSSLQDMESATEIHADVVETGYDSDAYVGTTLIDLYVKCGSLVNARQVFDKMPRRDVVCWSAMILGYAQMEQGEVALQLYAEMQREHVEPNGRTFVGALKACSSLAKLDEGNEGGGMLLKRWCLEQVRAIHSQVVKRGFESAVFVGTMLVAVYAKCGSLVEARSVFERMPQRNVVSWTAMILGYAQMEEGKVALQLYAQMQQVGVVPNNRTYIGVLRACSSLAASTEQNKADGILLRRRCLEQVRTIHSVIIRTGSELAVFVGTMLVDVYAKCQSLVDARSVFEAMPQRNVVSWNAMILGYAQMGEGKEALQLYTRMQQEGVVPDERTFVGALKACSSLTAWKEGNQGDEMLVEKNCLKQVIAIHSDIVNMELKLNVFVASMLVNVYAKCGSLVDARNVFENMQHRNVVSWTAMILGYAHIQEGELALKLYARMQQEGIDPDNLTFIAALKACSSVAALEKGKEIHAQISTTGLQPTNELSLANTLIDMYGKCGSMIDAEKVFESCRARDVVTWNALIAGYAHQGKSDIVFDLFERMREEGIQPNGVTFLSILTACNHMGLADKGHKYFEGMSRDYEIAPTIEHYNCLVDLLGRAGHLDRAIAIVKAMPFQPDIAIWQTVLGACRKWNDVELGTWAFECARRLGNNDDAIYALMTNIYAASCMWEEVKRIQEIRVSTRVWKNRGKSWWIDSDGTVHMFMVGDSNHLKQDLYDHLRFLYGRMT